MQAEQQWMGLARSLEQMAVDYDQFRDLCLKQRRSLIQNEHAALASISREMEILADDIYLMDERRRMHMEILSEASDREMLNLEELADLWPSFDFESIRVAAKRLRAIRTEIDKIVRVNAALIQSSRGLIQATMEAIVRIPDALHPISQKVYGANGVMAPSRPAVRNLLNRKG